MPSPDLRDPAVLAEHAAGVLHWWARSPKPASGGGLFHCLRDDGSVFDTRTRHLVSSTRLCVQFAWAITHGVPEPPAPAPSWRALLDSSLAFLRRAHRQGNGGYAWILNASGDEARVESAGAPAAAAPAAADEESTQDLNVRAYGLAFVLLAYSSALAAGTEGAREWVDEVTATLTARFWEEAHGLYADEASADFSVLDRYRGQNANMHAVEAHMAAFRATRDALHLARARTIARSMCVRQAALVDAATGAGALVYEHYSPDWSAPDLEFNKDKPKDRFRPYGFQPGHLLEWSKLLCQLEELGPEEADGAPPAGGPWRLATAARFFEAACRGWDTARGGGFVYSCSPVPGLPLGDKDKYKWPQAEGVAAAALLANAADKAGDAALRDSWLAWYDKIIALCWAHFVDHKLGSWFRVLGPNLEKLDDRKCPQVRLTLNTFRARPAHPARYSSPTRSFAPLTGPARLTTTQLGCALTRRQRCAKWLRGGRRCRMGVAVEFFAGSWQENEKKSHPARSNTCT
jgi:hypothetical protein